MPTSFGTSGGGHVTYAIFLNAFEWALPMNAYPSIPIPISTRGDTTRQSSKERADAERKSCVHHRRERRDRSRGRTVVVLTGCEGRARVASRRRSRLTGRRRAPVRRAR